MCVLKFENAMTSVRTPVKVSNTIQEHGWMDVVYFPKSLWRLAKQGNGKKNKVITEIKIHQDK